MSPQAVGDQLLIRFLLGDASAEDTARLDEWSVADDQFAGRLRAAENELVDAYVNGELSGETLERFKAFYLTSALRLQRVKFAEAFQSVLKLHPARRPRTFAAAWGFAVAACAMLMLSASLLYENRRLHTELALQPLVVRSPSQPVPALVLSPQTRGAAAVAAIAVAPGVARVAFELVLETEDLAHYRVTLKDPADARGRWTSGDLQVRSGRVAFNLPAAVLGAGNYALELSGIAANGATEQAGTYTFQVVRQ